MNSPLYHYVRTFFVSYYSLWLKVYFVRYKCSYLCEILQSEQFSLWISRYGEESEDLCNEGWHLTSRLGE